MGGRGDAIRSFIALALPGEVTEALRQLIERLRRDAPDYRWARPEAMHLTLRFLGDLAPDDFRAVGDRVAEGFDVGGPLDLAPEGLGAFANPRKARVVWVGVAGEGVRLARLAGELDVRLEPCGIAREARPFRPHLTLGRAKRGRGAPPDLRRLVGEHQRFRGPGWVAREVLLYESRLQPGRAVHTVRARGAIT